MNLPTGNIVENARELAFKYHEGQMYGDDPYVDHLQSVVNSLLTNYGDLCAPVLLATAWLHDSREGTGITRNEIADACGEQVEEAVEALTKIKYQVYEDYIATVKANPIALEVKRHDTLQNLTASVLSGEKGRIRKYSRQLLLLVGE